MTMAGLNGRAFALEELPNGDLLAVGEFSVAGQIRAAVYGKAKKNDDDTPAAGGAKGAAAEEEEEEEEEGGIQTYESEIERAGLGDVGLEGTHGLGGGSTSLSKLPRMK